VQLTFYCTGRYCDEQSPPVDGDYRAILRAGWRRVLEDGVDHWYCPAHRARIHEVRRGPGRRRTIAIAWLAFVAACAGWFLLRTR
jgi:hypothetical protein